MHLLMHAIALTCDNMLLQGAGTIVNALLLLTRRAKSGVAAGAVTAAMLCVMPISLSCPRFVPPACQQPP